MFDRDAHSRESIIGAVSNALVELTLASFESLTVGFFRLHSSYEFFFGETSVGVNIESTDYGHALSSRCDVVLLAQERL